VTDFCEMLMRTALVSGGDRGVVDIGVRLHVAELFVPELRKVAAGRVLDGPLSQPNFNVVVHLCIYQVVGQ